MDHATHYRSRAEICASWGPVVIRICDGMRTEIDDLVRLQKLFDELLEVHPNIAMLVVFTHGTPMPDGATQRYAKESMQKYYEHLTLAVALLGLGFWASAVRTGLGTLVRIIRGHSVSIDGSVEVAATHLTTELIGIDREQLLAVYEDVWAELQQPQLARVGS